MSQYNSEQLNFIRLFLNKCKVFFNTYSQLDGLLIPRDIFLDDEKYYTLINSNDFCKIKELFSSSLYTSLHKTASKKQKFLLLNLVRQILRGLYFKMTPIRKSNGYDKTGKKLFKRYFLVEKMKVLETSSIISVSSND
jgi:hypothetical protein